VPSIDEVKKEEERGYEDYQEPRWVEDEQSLMELQLRFRYKPPDGLCH
jgi:hypothetical protein